MKTVASLLIAAALTVVVLANEAPTLSPFDPFEFAEGSAFAVLRADKIVTDPDHSLRDLEWRLADTDDFWLSVMGTQLYIGAVDAAWTGTASFKLVVCDPDGACDEQTIEFTVLARNDPPVLAISDQVISAGESFSPIELSTAASDPDDPFDDLQWTVTGNSELSVEIDGSEARISPPSSDWAGVEYVEFTVCDPAGACTSQLVVIARLDGTETTLHHIGNAGYIIESASLSMAIDAFFSLRAAPSMTRGMREGATPFDVDLILVTQGDSYHVSPQLIAMTMLAQEHTTLVAPAAVVSAVLSLEPSLDASRCQSLDLDAGDETSLTAAGISIQAKAYARSLTDGDPLVGYAFTLDGKAFLFLGELSTESFTESDLPLGGASAEFAFVPRSVFGGVEDSWILSLIDARWTIPVCSTSTTYGCNCLGTGTSELCLDEEMQRALLPTN